MPTLSPTLRKALLNLPQKEKDQLLVRLVCQDKVLTEQLQFRLLEGDEALEERRSRLRERIDDPVRGYHQTPNDLLLILRQLQSQIGYHSKITADQFGEVELTVRLLNNVFRHQPAAVARLSGTTQPLLSHLARRADTTLRLADKLDPDYHLELADGVNELLTHLWSSAAAPLARDLGLPRQWGSFR
ncbi:hypothetical protein EJV47_27065 [Hymenobacter gummosus]|uniref:Uncharacterized protein n=1 Tax=Hymenobacter gummosus TaxID=1776032 RepID=A0A431TUI5_9BACT|nr:hypothetical protein [Hymenobacter gummosus]RTQ44869.1 hypothetical protein EJV47_27065 [Hymenobacter gummosus]